MKLEGVVGEFVLYWGGVGTRWGVPEETARVQAFLYIMEDPYNVTELTKALELPRAKVKSAVDTLLAWDAIEAVEVEGAKGDYYLCEYEPWDLVWRLTVRRGELELGEAIPWMSGLVARSEAETSAGAYETARIAEAARFTRLIERGLADLKRMPSLHLATVSQLGSRVAKFMGLSKE